MGSWGPSIFSDDLALDVRREYNTLLSVGKSNDDVEELLINYYSSILYCNDPDEDVFWFSLALCEWKKGRLSSFVKQKALDALENGRNLERWRTLESKENYKKRKKELSKLRDTILSPMPPMKKIRKPTVHHCPWKVGSLLAYRIVANEQLLLRKHPCYMKYVLLRVVSINQRPISSHFDTGYYDESMLVGLYNWIGDEIPDPEIVSSLEYIPISENSVLLPKVPIDTSLLDELTPESKNIVNNALNSFLKRKEEKCIWLNWRSSKAVKGDITLLDWDESFLDNIPAFFGSSPDSYTFTSFLSFDISLSKRFCTGDGSVC